MASLEVEEGQLAGKQFELGTGLLIGRTQGDVVLEDEQVSRRHAIVRPVDGGYEIEDLGSTNGTFVDGVQIVAPTRLEPGALISVGDTRARFAAPALQPTSIRPRIEPGATPTPSRLVRAVAGHRGKKLTVGVWLLLAILIGGGFGSHVSKVSSALTGSVDALGSNTQSARIAAIERRRFPGGETYTTSLVYRRATGLTPADRARVDRDARAVARIPGTGQVLAAFSPGAPLPLVSQNRQVALTIVQLTYRSSSDRDKTIKAIRRAAGTGTGGLQVRLTGPAAYASDLNTAIGKADVALLAATGVLVLALLMLIYRSPLLALIPLVVVGVAYFIATGLIYIYAKATGEVIDKTVLTLLAVLMFGAGTDYCLLLVSRYTADLRQTEDHHVAMASALGRTTHAIVASGCTVAGAMLTFFLAELKTDRQLAAVNAIGILVVMIAGITLLPALLTLAGRRAFWPNGGSVVVQPGRSLTGVIDAASVLGARPNFWFRLATRVTRRPVLAILGTVAILGTGAVGWIVFREDVNQRTQFRIQNDSTRGLALLRTGFPPGASYPETVLLRSERGALNGAQLRAARARIASIPGVAEVSQPLSRSRDGSLATLSVAYRADPFSDRGLAMARRLRADVAHLEPGVTALVGGGSSARVDYKDALNRDIFVIVAAVLVVIFLMLALLLRALVAPLYLIATVLLSYFGTLGVSLLVFKYVFGQNTVDPFYPLITFVFLVALGVDYNIFLMSRVREEALVHGTRTGLLRALVATGSVVTSAGLILAGTFAMLTILPLWILLEIGFTVSLGVLIDTFIVRTLAVPAIVRLVGDASWWPSSVRSGSRAPVTSGVFEVPPAMRAKAPAGVE